MTWMASSTAIPIHIAPTIIVPRSNDSPINIVEPPTTNIGSMLGKRAIKPYLNDLNKTKKLRPIINRAKEKDRLKPLFI